MCSHGLPASLLYGIRSCCSPVGGSCPADSSPLATTSTLWNWGCLACWRHAALASATCCRDVWRLLRCMAFTPRSGLMVPRKPWCLLASWPMGLALVRAQPLPVDVVVPAPAAGSLSRPGLRRQWLLAPGCLLRQLGLVVPRPSPVRCRCYRHQPQPRRPPEPRPLPGARCHCGHRPGRAAGDFP